MSPHSLAPPISPISPNHGAAWQRAIAHVGCVVHGTHIAGDHKIFMVAAAAKAVSGGELLAISRRGFHGPHA